MMILPPQVNTAISMLYAAGYEAFLVGGAVRDYVRGNSPAKDWDITINALCRVTRLWACGFSEIVAKSLRSSWPLLSPSLRISGTAACESHMF